MNRSYWLARWQSLGHALRGIGWGLRRQPHLRIHALATLVVAGLSVGLRVERWEACILALCVGQVWAAELLNTALESLTDLVSPQHQTQAGRVKDIAAAAVLVLAGIAVVVAVLVFWPYVVG